jgi:uncharacterized protein (TIGR02266 family)
MPAPIKLTIKFKATSLDEFVERYGVYVSQGGIFVRTKKPLAVGTALDFEFKLLDGSTVLKGLGTVVWTRDHDPARRNVPAGMGLRYDSLDDASRDRLAKILEKKGESQVKNTTEPTGDIVTSPGNQEEKTKVASADVLKKLRGDILDGSNEISPASALFDDDVENLRPDMDDLVSDKKEDKSKTPETAETPKKEESDFFSEAQKKKGEVKTDWKDEPTPLPSRIHPFISPDAEEDDDSGKIETEEPNLPVEVSIADEAKEELLATIRMAKAVEVEKRKKEEEPKVVTKEDSKEVKKDSKSVKDDESKKKREKTPSIPIKSSSDVIDNALAKSSKKRDSGGIEGIELKETGFYEESEETPGSKTWMFILVLIVVAGAAGGYWYKFLRNQTKKENKQSNTIKRIVKKNPPSMGATKDASPVMKIDPTGDASPVMKINPTVDATNTVDGTKIINTKNSVDATKSGDIKDPPPVVIKKVEPPKIPDAITCKEGEISIPVTSVPTASKVTVNGIKKGTTPVSVCLRTRGNYSVIIKHPGYLNGIEYFSKKIKEGASVHKQLKHLPRTIIIQTRPKKVMIYIDGKKIGVSTISTRFKQPQELWKIKLIKRGYVPKEFIIKSDDPKWNKKSKSYRYELFYRMKKL